MDANDRLMPASCESLVGEIPMPALSHTVKANASPNYHICDITRLHGLSHNVEVDKNNGPNHLKAWREFREMSQEELAEKVGTTASQISMLETGDRGLSAKWLRKLAPVLKTTPGHLLDHDPSSVDSDIFDIWMGIDQRDRQQAIRVLRALKTGTQD